MIRRTLAHGAVVLCLAILSVPTFAWGAPKVALTAIDGDTEGELRDAVADALDGDELKLVSRKETARAVDKLGDAADLNEKLARKLAKSLGADAVVVGTLDMDGAIKKLRFRLFVNGKERKGFSVKFKSATSGKFKKALRKKMVQKLAGAGGGAAAGGDDEADEEEDAAPKKAVRKGGKAAKAEQAAKAEREERDAGEDDEEPAALKPKKGAKAAKKGKKTAKAAKAEKAEKADEPADEERAAKGDEGYEGDERDEGDEAPAARKPPRVATDFDEEDEAPRSKRVAAADDDDDASVSRRAEPRGAGAARPANRAAIRVDLGASMIKRQLTFNARADLPANLAPKAFEPAPVGGGRISGEIYPLALSGDGLASGLGVAASYDRTASLNVNSSVEPGVDVPVERYNYSAGLRFRIVGKRPTSPSVTLGFDVGRSRFRADRDVLMSPSNLALPDTYYKYFAPGVGARLPLGTRVALLVHGDAMLVTDAGQIVRGYSYGEASVFGFEAMAGVDVALTSKIWFRLTGELTQVGFDFVEPGGQAAKNVDGDPTTFDIGGALDRTFGGSVTVGVAY